MKTLEYFILIVAIIGGVISQTINYRDNNVD